ncbi:MAG: serine protease, partial [Bacteroidetes bacterium QH_10_64_19]
ALQVSAPYRPVASSALVVPVTAPARTSALRVSLVTPAGRRVRHVERVGHPGPNRIAVDPEGLSPGLYRFEVHTDAGHRAAGHVTITE